MAFTKISLCLTPDFSFAEKILFMKLGFRSFIVLNVSKAKFLSFFVSIDYFGGLVSAVLDSRWSNPC